ncbi:MAG TPA: hypothetical protein VH092_36055 [Urbifossiella sp.]|jgi:hypothetical protein|nr:hypothetical protein [Urbifossiella sp.]
MAADENVSAADQFAAAAVVLGLVSLGVCWWFPFGPVLGVIGTGLGILAWWTGRDGERALVGMTLAATGAGAGLLLAWDYWWRAFGL